MNKVVRIFGILMFNVLLMACALGELLAANENPTPAAPAVTIETPIAIQPASTPTPIPVQETATDQPATDLDPCSLITAAEAETFLAEPASAPNAMNGACIFSNAKDALYTVSAAAAQDEQTNGILQGQAMLLGFAGGQLDEARMNKIKSLAAALDYKGFFTELVAAAEGSPMLKARLIEGGGNDLVYWAWITVQTRRQGAFVAVRGSTLVNINLVVAETQTEEAMLAASTALAEQIFGRLPAKFTLAIPTTAPAQPAPSATPTEIIAVIETPPTPTEIPAGLPAPILIAPADGTSFDYFPRTTKLEWRAVPGASKYAVEIEACNKNKAQCFSLSLKEIKAIGTNTSAYTFDFVGSQPGRWRVWAIDANGQAGAKSDWWFFTYTK